MDMSLSKGIINSLCSSEMGEVGCEGGLCNYMFLCDVSFSFSLRNEKV